MPGCTSAAVTTTILVVVSVVNGGGPEPNLRVYAFDGTTYTGYNGTTSAAGQVTLTLPIGNYRFRADKGGVQYWSGTANHCTVPGGTAATVAVSGQARAPSGNPLASRSPLVEPMALLMAPLLVGAVFRRRRKGRYWV